MSLHFKSSRALVAAALIGAIGLGTAYWQARAVGQEEKPVIKQQQVHQAEQLSAAFRHAAEVAMPSTVTIRSKAKAHAITKKGHGPHESGQSLQGNPVRGYVP